MKSKSSMRGRTKTRPTKRRQYVVQIGSEQFHVPQTVFRKLRKDLERYQVNLDSVLTSEQFFGSLLEDRSGWATNLRGLRYREDLTQVEFAKAIGVTQSNLSAMENGNRCIGKEIANRIAATFNVDYRYFL